MRLTRLFFIAVLVCCIPAHAGEVLEIAFDGASMPIMYAGPHGEPRGIYPAIVAAACAQVGQPVRIVVRPFRRVLEGLRTGELAGGSVVLTAARARGARFSAPYMTEQVAVYYRAGSARPAAGVSGLRGKRVGVIRGWSYGPRFDAARASGLFEVEEVDSDEANLRKLALGRIDTALAATAAGELLRRQPGIAALAKGPTLVSVPIRLAISARDPHAAMLPRFDRAIAHMRRSGELAAIESAEIERAARAHASAAHTP